MNIERILTPSDYTHIEQQFRLLAHGSLPLLHSVTSALQHATAWTTRLNKDRSFSGLLFWRDQKEEEDRLSGSRFDGENEVIVRELEEEIERYRREGRLEVIDPFKVRFSPSRDSSNQSGCYFEMSWRYTEHDGHS